MADWLQWSYSTILLLIPTCSCFSQWSNLEIPYLKDNLCFWRCIAIALYESSCQNTTVYCSKRPICYTMWNVVDFEKITSHQKKACLESDQYLLSVSLQNPKKRPHKYCIFVWKFIRPQKKASNPSSLMAQSARNTKVVPQTTIFALCRTVSLRRSRFTIEYLIQSDASSESFSDLMKKVRMLYPDASSPTSLFPILSTVSIIPLNRPELTSELYKEVVIGLSHAGEDEIFTHARRMREALIKSWPLVGFPYVINCMHAFKSAAATSEHGQVIHHSKLKRPANPTTDPTEAMRLRQAGRGLFDNIYRHNSERVLNALRSSSSDLHNSAVEIAYGLVLSPSHILSNKETGLLELTGCVVMGCGPQAKGHMMGAKNMGATAEEVEIFSSSIWITQLFTGGKQRVLQDEKVQDEMGQECPHDNLMAEAEEEGFSNYRVVNRHFQLNTQASTSPSPNMPPKAYETPADLAQAAKDYGGDTQREQMFYISQTGSAGQKACLREEGLSTSNINKAFLDAAKDILKNN
ncbi:hypothetical protein PROFUN_12055 [Planoprotostelium fungivorum]|uniref:Uncharacterized protein n=1 Tax=Planoprotostelium fungivorum TaxID=1890364 RepID=A0A2P6MXN7_9EUKA|nr:hypothetical protein PROFUN_12055 [Planoprotostelium fungivorum]